MPGCSAAVATAASMTGSTDLGPIQPQQLDTVPLLDDSLFAEDSVRHQRIGRYSARQELRTVRRKMTTQTGQPVQLTPLWEYVVRTKKFPKDVDVTTIFDEISERLRDPEWEVRQHALRVLVDVLPTFGAEEIDEVASLVLSDLIDNLGNPAPAVRKGSLDTLRIYLLHTPRRDEITKKILHAGMNRADVLDDYETSIATGVILSAPLLLFPSRSSTRPANQVVREATQALAMRLVQVTHQESALRSLAKIREAIGDEEFGSYLREVDDSMKRNFELLCDVYGIQRSSSSSIGRKRPRSKGSGRKRSADLRRKDSVEDSIKDVVAVDKSWESEDSDTSGIAEEDEDGIRPPGSGSISSARVVLETQIKFNEETAITMTILEEQDKEIGAAGESDESDDEDEVEAIDAEPATEAPDDEVLPEERRRTPRRVHFGGEVVKLRTPDSEDAESVMSDAQHHQQQHHLMAPPRTRIPLPVSPATRLPQPPRRPRSSSHPNTPPQPQRRQQRPRRSASNSPRREVYTHNANLSPKKSILTKSSEFGDRRVKTPDDQEVISKPRTSRRDSITPVSSPRVVIEEIVEPAQVEPAFCVCEEPNLNLSPKVDNSVLVGKARTPSPTILGDKCGIEDKSEHDIDSIFGDRSGLSFQDKLMKDHENMIRSGYRSRSALEKTTKFDADDDVDASGHGRERRRSQSAKIPGFEVFPRQERNYILMELSSPVKDMSRRASLEDNPNNENPNEIINTLTEKDETSQEKSEETSKSASAQDEEKPTEEPQVDSNKTVESENVEEQKSAVEFDNSEEYEGQLCEIDDDLEKSALDAKERSSDSSSDGEWRNKEPSWEELGLVDDEVLTDFHNKDDWRARVRGLERIASALRTPSALSNVEPRLGSLLHAVLGGERSCRVAAAGLAVAKVVLTGVSEEALTDRLSLIAWGLARQGGPNAAHLARLTMLRTSPGLFLEKLLQPQCIGARNAKMRENTLQLLIFSLVTFPSTEFKVKSAIDKVVAMVGDRRKRVRHSALDTLAVLSQIYESEDILEASKRFTKGKQDGQTIHAAIKTRLSRKLLPTVSVDGLVVYGLQISSNSQHAVTGADVEWIIAGSGSVSPGTGRTRGQLIAMSKMENAVQEQNNIAKKPKVRPASEHSNTHGTVGRLLENNERTASWKLLPQSDQNDEIKLKKVDRTSKSADLSKVNNTDFAFRSEEIIEKESKTLKPYATPKRSERKSERQILLEENSNQIRESNTPVQKQESRIPIYTGDRTPGTKVLGTEMSRKSRDKSPTDTPTHRDCYNDYSDNNGYLTMLQRRKHQTVRSAAPRANNYTANYAYSNSYKHSQYEKSFDDLDADLKIKQGYENSPHRQFKENNERALSYEKLNKGFDNVIKNSRAGLRSVPHYQYSSKTTESYESIYQRQRRLKEDKGARVYETSPSPLSYGYEYDGYNSVKKVQSQTNKSTKEMQGSNRSPQKRRMFVSPFDDCTTEKSMGLLDKDAADQETDSNPEPNQGDSTRTLSGSKSASIRVPSPRHDAEEARSNSGSSSSSSSVCGGGGGGSSNRSASSGRRLRSGGQTLLPAHAESDESNEATGTAKRTNNNSRASSPSARSEDKAFDVIYVKSNNPSRRGTPDAVSIRSAPKDDLEGRLSSNDLVNNSASKSRGSPSSGSSTDTVGSLAEPPSRSKSAQSLVAPAKLSFESLRDGSIDDYDDNEDDDDDEEEEEEEEEEDDRPPPAYNGHGNGMTPSASTRKSSSRCSSGREYSARASTARSMVDLNDMNGEDREPSESPEEDDAAFETLDFRNAARDALSAASSVVNSAMQIRAITSYEYDENDLRNTESNITLYSCNSVIMSPKNLSPKRFINEDPEIKETDSDETPPHPIGFDDGANRVESSDGSDETDDVSLKPQPSRLPTPVDHPRRLFKVAPCKMRPQANCHRSTSVPTTRHYDKHAEKSSKMVQQCFNQLESKDWEVTLKGLRSLSQIAKDDPEQLDVCAPGLLARLLGRQVKNLRSQVARVACSAAGDVFSAHIRGIEQDLDEIAGALLHRTADTNRFLRQDCNIALDNMIEHFPPHRTIMTIANRGASHQNTIVHATTARLLYVIVNELGPEHAMILPRDVRDKLFMTTAQLLTDGNLQARKHAKDTFRLLSRCEGFRKALTDAVPENTLRLIDKILRSL